MAHQQNHSKARQLDQFYTNPKTAQACISYARKQLAHLQLETAIEPSAGTGAFANQLGQPCISIDIDPKQDGMIRADFLTWQPQAHQRSCLVIGNPPFGKNASLAVKFFNHAAGFADAIAFIVPLSFRKTSIQSRLDCDFHMISALSLPGEIFLLEGKDCQISCEFQVWERRNMPREIVKLTRTHPDFELCKREHADIAVQRVGANAGRVKDVAEAGSAPMQHPCVVAWVSSASGVLLWFAQIVVLRGYSLPVWSEFWALFIPCLGLRSNCSKQGKKQSQRLGTCHP